MGSLTQSSNANVTINYTAFDGDGRVTASTVQTAGVTCPFSYQYDLAGDLIQETYPSGRQVNTTYDLAMRPLTTSGVSGGTTTKYVQQVGYFPHGAPQYWQYGSGLWSWQSFSKLLQPQQSWATENNNGSQWMFYANNGFNTNETVISQNEGFGPAVPWNSLTFLNGQFAYDNLNRLTSVTDTNYTRSYHYDEFGNLSVQTNTVVPLSGLTPVNNGSNPYNPGTNHLVTVDSAGGYDPRGMITKLGGGTVTMAYDADGNMKNTADTGTGQSITWIFDAEGQRAQKSIAGGSWTLYIHDAFGQLAASYNNNGVTPDCTTCYLTYDMLGSARMITDQSQNIVARHDFIPFGEEIQNGVAGRNGNFGYTSNVTQAFTGQERDGGTAVLDFFNARHMSGVLEGFVQPDPGNAGADIGSPQSWNGYGYVLGNPLGLVDPTGMSSNYSGIGDGYCPASQQTCATGNPSVMTGWRFPNEINSGESNYVQQVVLPGYLAGVSSNYPSLVQFFPAAGGQSYSIYYGQAGIARQSAAEVGVDPLGGEWAGALYMLAQNVPAQQAFLGKFAGAAVAAGTGVAGVLQLSALSTSTMEIAVGPGASSVSPFHIAYQADGEWLHAAGSQFFKMAVRSRGAAGFATKAWFKFGVPVLSPGAVAATEGCTAWSCVTAAGHAFLKGWGLPF